MMHTRHVPYAHKVRSHIRSGVKVRKYIRGEGDKPEDYVVPRSKTAQRQGANLGMGPLYNVTIKYEESKPEVFAVRTNDPQSALSNSIVNSRSPYVPREIVLKRR